MSRGARGLLRDLGLLVGLAALLAAPAGAVSYADDELFLLNTCAGGSCTATGLQLQPGDVPEPLASIPLLKLDDTGDPTILNDPNSDYFLRITQTFVEGPANPNKVSLSKNAVFSLTFEVGWYGTQNGEPTSPPDDAFLLFVLTANRLGPNGVTDPPIDAGYVRNSFSGDIGFLGVARDTPNGQGGLIPDTAGGQDYLGILLPLVAPTSGAPGEFAISDLELQTFTTTWALRQPISFGPGDFFQHVNSGFIVPEPGALSLVGAALAALAVARRRRV